MRRRAIAVVELCWRDPTVSESGGGIAGKMRSTRPRRAARDVSIYRPRAAACRAGENGSRRHRAKRRLPRAALRRSRSSRVAAVTCCRPCRRGRDAHRARLARVLGPTRARFSALQRPNHGAPPPRDRDRRAWPAGRIVAHEAEPPSPSPWGDFTAAELLRRIASGAISEEGVMLAAESKRGVAIDGQPDSSRFSITRRAPNTNAAALAFGCC